MSIMYRRQFLHGMLLLPAGIMSVSANISLAQQGLDKPQLKLSEVKPMVMHYIDSMSQASKDLTGVEFTLAQKTEMADALILKMKDQRIYDFVDP